jgi:hypothetical protein
MNSPDFAVGQRVRVNPGSSEQRYGVIVEDFGDSAPASAKSLPCTLG